MAKQKKNRRKFEGMHPSKALKVAHNLLQRPYSPGKYELVRELSHWKASSPTCLQLKEYMEAINRTKLLDAYVPVETDSEAAKIIARMLEEDPALAEDFVLDQMERLILAKVEKRVIAQIMGVNVSTVYLWGKMAAKRRQEQYDSMPAWIVPGFAGDVLYTYEKIKQLGFQMIYEEGASHYKQMQGIRILFRAQQAIVDYQTKLGLYDDKSKLLPPRPDAGAEYQQAEYQQAERKHFPIADLLRLEQIIQSAADQNIQDQEDIHSQCLDEKFPEQNIVDFVSQMSREASGSQQSARKAPTAA